MKNIFYTIALLAGYANAQVSPAPGIIPKPVPCTTTIYNPFISSENGSGIGDLWNLEPADRSALCAISSCPGPNNNNRKWAVENLNAYDCSDPYDNDCDNILTLCEGCENLDIYKKYIMKCQRDHNSPQDGIVFDCCENLLLNRYFYPEPLDDQCYANYNGDNDGITLYPAFINTTLLWNEEDPQLSFSPTPIEPITDWLRVWLVHYEIRQSSTYPENQRIEYNLLYIRMDSSPEGSYMLLSITSNKNCVNDASFFAYDFEGNLTYGNAPISIEVSEKCQDWCQVVN